ncbi:hypothetical protein [Chryseosolibacter indicus]|uniref:YdhG-like domain-containing protein n=1 Tax=Chryseosolibacter indicus TaxID=2782351 RepID=A0ABS5VP57_9BACT|nr:hypothetical protein [Chryseosolibacter indicus]MBT1702803.1 hypothetical protein [Chryseosolibacter indicus]
MVIKHTKGFKTKVNTNVHYEVWTDREAVIKNLKRRPGVMFVSLILYKDYVGLYFQPLYFNPSLLSEIPKNLLPYKKGVTSFHFRELSASQLLEIELLIILGLSFYKSKHWV